MKAVHYLSFLLGLCILVQAKVLAKEEVNIHLSKKADTWYVTYTTNTLTDRIAFISNPDDARTKRWKSTNDEFEVVYDNKQEFIQKKDGKAFSRVQLTLTPTYTHLPKSYAPFAPYSDGGALIHTGRLFACMNRCDEDANGGQLQVEVEDNTHIIANGKIYQQSANWKGYDDGQYVYIGRQSPIEEDTFIAVVDANLPEKIKIPLNQSLPKIMAFFESHLGKYSSNVKPMLFASYSNTSGQDIQGGVLPNQVFIHWNMNNLNERLKDEDFITATLWTFAHEAAHFYQNSPLLGKDKSESWIHEGNAEWLAAIALRELYPEISESFIAKKWDEAKANCIDVLISYRLADAADKGKYRPYYQCGMIIHSIIDKKTRELSQGKYTIFDVWKDFKNTNRKAGKNNAEYFWAATDKYIPSDVKQGLKQLIKDRLASPSRHIDHLEAL
ncbi:hypothetical protein [Alteromonas lipotrueiana]|uniref:hypothetical protein n=1 Tax=Alteromonas lipotrueiana TaxID=2803815 RepID=UPI001C4806A5|nr:hypothetical protein [Alteromonas lipotrueiana]